MQWIKTGRQLGQAVKNVGRFRQIVAIFTKYGFADFFERMRLTRFLPSRIAAFTEEHADEPIQARLRLAFEELGPTFVKLGQLLSSRPDLVPDAFIEEFRKLQDDVQPLSFEIVKGVVERELGQKLEDAYAWFSEKPLAAASIGQVHEARLKTGETVVVKVQRPEIERIIETDISLLAFLAGLLEKYVPESRVIGPKTVVNEFFRTLTYELDFVIESNNMAKMAENLLVMPEIVIPRVYKQLSSHKILTLEKLEGLRVSDRQGMEAAGVNRKRIVEIGARAFFRSVMIDGLFHGDLHGGNLFILPGDRLGIIDFGVVGRLSQKSRDQLASMVMALLTEDYETLCYHYAELGAAGPSIDFDGFTRDVRNTLSPHMGLSLKELNVGKVLIDATKIAANYQIQVPGDWMLVFKAILTLEGMGRTLDPDFDLLSLGEEMIREIVKNQYSVQRVSKDLLFFAKDAGSLLQTLPRQIRWMLRKLNANDFALEIKSQDFQEIRDQLDLNGRRQSLSTLVVGCLVTGAILAHGTSSAGVLNLPVATTVFFSIGAFFLTVLLFRALK
jgi:ubiquinone biosynthesis protein